MGFNNFYDLDKGDLNKASEKNTEHRLGRYVYRRVNNTNYTIVLNQDHFIEFHNLTGNRTLNLPDIATVPVGQTYIIKKDGSGHSITLDPFSSQTVNGSATYTLSGSHGTISLIATPTEWHTW
jgi:hypothetical protein